MDIKIDEEKLKQIYFLLEEERNVLADIINGAEGEPLSKSDEDKDRIKKLDICISYIYKKLNKII